MITGAIIFFIGIVLGYSLDIFVGKRPVKKIIKKLTSRKAKIIEIVPPIDLGN